MKLPVLIVGQGLAGTALAWRLWERDVRFVIADPDEDVTASKIAAGLVTPVTGKRLNLSWRIDELLPEARAFYARVEKVIARQFYHESEYLRLLNDEREVAWWKERQSRGELLPWLQPAGDWMPGSSEWFRDELGGFVQRHAGWLDTGAYLKASREFFAAQNAVRTARVEEGDLEVGAASVRWQGADFAFVIFCRGWREQASARFFPWLKFDSAQGVIAALKADLPGERIVNRSAWLLPRGNGQWRTGSTYEFDFALPMEDSIADLRGKLERLLKVPFEITAAQRGVRPIVKQRQLILGRHPAHDRICVMNGLGSKGVLRTPFFARMLVEHLLDDKPLEAVVDVRSND
jgi:glycine/D-amino acid oxidase-like deaminating enzyme